VDKATPHSTEEVKIPNQVSGKGTYIKKNMVLRNSLSYVCKLNQHNHLKDGSHDYEHESTLN